MATEAQVRANRLNAQRSTGPRTPEGKVQVSQNAVRHGLLAREGVIRGESRQEYEVHREMLLEEMGPVGALEGILASRVVDLTWRLRRAGQDRNEAFGALYDRYVAREGSAGPEAGSDGAMALGVEDIPASKRGRDARDTQGQDALATGGQSLLRANRGDADDTSTAAERGATLGRMILEDFEQDAVLERLLRHERRIEGSLYRTLNELRRLRDQSRKADREAAETLARWREEDGGAQKARMFAFDRPLDGPPGPAGSCGRDDVRQDSALPDGPPGPSGGTTNTPWSEVPPASEVPFSPSADPVPDSPREDETCETNPIETRRPGAGPEDETCETKPIPERVSSWKCQVASESCETNPISPDPGEGQVACSKEVRDDSSEKGRTETKPIYTRARGRGTEAQRERPRAAGDRLRKTKPIGGGVRFEV